MACNDRQLSEAQRQAGYQQQRTGVMRAVRPFSGSATVENLVDYINRELGPAVRATRDACNDVFKQVADNAPSANPLAYYFATSTVNADPTVGRMRLDQAVQNTATVIRVSQSNGRLQDVTPWLDVMSGGPTIPLGTLTMIDAINPGRFLRFDLNSMTDQGAYWDLGVTIIESSTANPFVEDEPVVVSFIAGVSAAGSTVPVGSLSPVARDTFLGNIGTGTAAPAAVPLASVDSTSIVYDGTAHEFRSAAKTGAIAIAANANASLFAGILDNGAAETDRTNLNFLSSTSVISVVTDDAGNDELEITHERAGLTGFAAAAQNSNATTSAEPIVTYSASANMSAERVTTSSTSVTVSTAVASQIEFQRAALTGEVTAAANANATTVVRATDFDTAPWTGNHQFDGQVALGTITTVATTGSINVTLGATSTRLVLSGTGTITLGTVSGAAEGRVLGIEFTGTGTHTITHDASSADAFSCPGNNDLIINGRGGVWAVARLGGANNWKIIGISNDMLQGTNTWTGVNTFSSTIGFVQRVLFTGVISPTTISSDQNDYSPTGWGTANVVRLISNNTTPRFITGALAGTAGEMKMLTNIGADGVNAAFTLSLESGSSAAANRWAGVPGTTLIVLTTGVIIWYDSTSSRWRIISGF